MDCKRRRVGQYDGVLSTGFLDLPSDMLIKILSCESIPVSERVRASRTCKAFYEVLSGPHAFSEVKELPGPEIQLNQFRKILESEKDTNTRSAMAKRLRSSVTALNLQQSRMSSFSELLLFTHAFPNLTELKLDTVGEFDLASFQFQPHKLHVSTLMVTVRYDQAKSFAILLNGLEWILDFSAVTHLTMIREIVAYNDIDLRHGLLEHDFENLQNIDLSLGRNFEIDALGELLTKNIGLKRVVLRCYYGKPMDEKTMSALCQLNLQHLSLWCPGMELRNDRWLTELAANSWETLESLAFRPATNHALDSIQQQQFKRLTNISLNEVPQSLTSVIAFINERRAGLPQIRLECIVERQEHETDEQEEELRSLISSESNAFDFFIM